MVTRGAGKSTKQRRSLPEVVVIGAGPAGLMAAGHAAAAGAKVRLLEGEKQPGQKLMLTGRRRCNLTNTLPLSEFLDGYGPNGSFLHNAYHRFFSTDLTGFLAGIGVKTAVERGGRIYPAHGGAETVLRALLRFAKSSGAQILTGKRANRLVQVGGGFIVSGSDFEFDAEQVILATGGASYSRTGSRGDGYRLAEKLGHRIQPLRPALVPVICSDTFIPRLASLRLRNVGLSFRDRGSKTLRSFGEVHFTTFGISGPAVFPVSKRIGELTASQPLPLVINLKPALDEKTLEARLLREFAAGGARPLEEVMTGLLPRQLIPVFLGVAMVSAAVPAAEVRGPVRQAILHHLFDFKVTATGTLPLEKGMVTAGGVSLREVDPVTMESRRVPGLFFCGEILDRDGNTGGFNLQAAFSTGFLAGGSAAGSPTPGGRKRQRKKT
jgi:predicted Rossmann fold flavoprotein